MSSPAPPRKRLLLDALHTFEVAARYGNFVDAAQELGVTTSAISHQIKRLENHLNLALFDRSTRTLQLTRAGQDLAAPLSMLFGRMHGLLADLQDESSKSLTISVMSSFGSKWLAPRVTRFIEKHPDLRLRVMAGDNLVDFMNEGVDIGIRFGHGNYPGLQAEHLMDVDAFPVCTPDFALNSGARLTEPGQLLECVLLHDESSLRAPGLPNWYNWLEAVDITLNHPVGGLVFENPQMALEAALAGQGVALGLSPLVQDDIRSGRLISPFQHRFRSLFSFWLVCLPDRANIKKINRFREWLAAEIRRSVKDGSA
jgi:LysR family glycine cleavage system transcriptional activator